MVNIHPNTILGHIYDSVNQGLDKAGLPRTLANQLDTMNRVERAMSDSPTFYLEQHIVLVLQKEIMRINQTNPTL